MLALSFDGPGRVEAAERRTPRILDDSDAIIRVTTAAIGPRDLARYAGPDPWPGTIPGAEFCGVVDEVGAGVASIDLGDLVTGLGVFETADGRRAFGWEGLDGGHALYIRVPFADTTLFRVPAAAIEERALLLGDTYGLGAAAADLAMADGAARIAVIGCDPYGASALIALAAAGVEEVVALDGDDRRLRLARRLGAVTFDTPAPGVDPDVKPDIDRVVETVREATGGDGPGAVILGAGAGSAQLGIALRIVRPDGLVVLTEPELPAALPGSLTIDSDNERGVRIQRARPPSRADVSKAMLALWGGALDLARLVSHVMPISDAAEGYRQLHARESGAHKILLKM